MTTAVIGATGRVGRAVVAGLIEDKRPVIAIVRDAARARQLFGSAGQLDTGLLDTGLLDTGLLDIRPAPLDRPAEVRAALDGAATVFIAIGSAGLEGNLQRAVIQAAEVRASRTWTGLAGLLIAREWALLAGENGRTTTGVQDLTGHPARTVEDFLHENREAFR